MQRHSSFFWATDDLRENGEEYSHDDGGDAENRDAEGIGWSAICEEENDDELEAATGGIDIEVAVASQERVALNKSYNGYGTANNGNGSVLPPPTSRRKPFEMPTAQAKGCQHSPDQSIRFQVVIWHIGTIDVQTGFVKMRFRLTLYWNDDDRRDVESTTKAKNADAVWVMEGRQRAYLSKHQEYTVKEMIDVPPVSIMNAVEFETVDAPEITMVDRGTSRSVRWTCMYNATLFQGDHMSVKDFPHDEHQIKLKFGILAHRGRGGRWDHNVHKLALADEGDSQGSTHVPHGLVVDHCHVPDFGFDPSDLRFQFFPLTYGGWKKSDSSREERDVFLQLTLPVYRQSGHYDTSILPVLVMLNIIAISCLARNFGSATAATELMLGIAFVQVGIRLTLDNRLPSVGYQIKMQYVMNCCFWLLCGLVLESNVVFFLVRKRGWDYDTTDRIDLAAACVALVYNAYIIVTYFRGKRSTPM